MLEQFLSSVPISTWVFFFFAAMTVLGSGGVAFSRNIVHSAFSLLFAFGGVVGLFALMSADFLAVVQLMVYVGGILVLILFAVMLTNKITEVQRSNTFRNLGLGLVLLAGVLAALLYTVLGYDWPTREPAPFAPTAETIGDAFLTSHLLPFEVAGLLLLAALVAAVVVARKEIRETGEDPDGGAS